MRRLTDRLLLGLAWGTSLGLLAGVGALVFVLGANGLPALGPSLLFGETPAGSAVLGTVRSVDGIWPAMVGTFALVLLASLIAVPIGVASGIYLAEYAPPRRRVILEVGVDMLAGVPSVVMGLFGFALILFLRRTLVPGAKTGLLLSAGCIALLVLPYLIRTTQTALQALPTSLRLVGPSLGFTHAQDVRWVRLPSASRGILSGVMLAVGRAAEDTAVIMLTGAVFHAGLPDGLTAKYEALPLRIYVLAAEHRNQAELAEGHAVALVLLLLTTLLLVASRQLQRSLEKRWSR